MARKRKAGPRTPSGQLSRAKEDAHCAPDTVMGPFDWPSVYVMSTGASVKIGFSRVLNARMKDIEQASDIPVKMFHAFRIRGAGAFKVEQTFHKLANGTKHHLRGEWYDLKPEIAVNAVRKIIERLGFEYIDHELFGHGRNGAK